MVDNNRAAKSIGWRQYRDLFERSEPQDPDACARIGQWLGLAGLSAGGHSDSFADIYFNNSEHNKTIIRHYTARLSYILQV